MVFSWIVAELVCGRSLNKQIKVWGSQPLLTWVHESPGKNFKPQGINWCDSLTSIQFTDTSLTCFKQRFRLLLNQVLHCTYNKVISIISEVSVTRSMILYCSKRQSMVSLPSPNLCVFIAITMYRPLTIFFYCLVRTSNKGLPTVFRKNASFAEFIFYLFFCDNDTNINISEVSVLHADYTVLNVITHFHPKISAFL